MPTALHIAVPSSQPHQGVAARLVRRLGGAVRSVIVRGIALAGALRRPTLSRTSHHHTAVQDPQAPAPGRLRAPLRPRTPSTSTSPALRAWAAKQTKAPTKRAGEGAAPLITPWLAPLLAARRHQRSAETSRPASLNHGDMHFTPQAFPQLSPKACAVLNTPLKDCDPKTLKLLVSAFTQYINQVMSPEAGITDPAAAFTNLWHRLNAALADTKADPSSSTTPQAVPATPADAAPNATAASPHPPVQAQPTAPTTQWTNQAPRASPPPLSHPPIPDQPADVPITAAPETTPDIATLSSPVGHASRSLSNPGRSFRSSPQSFARRRPRHVPRCRAFVHVRSLRDGPQSPPPPRRLYYAASTGPP